MSFFRKKKGVPFSIPETSSIMGTGGNIGDPRILIRNLAYDALLGSDVDGVLLSSFDMPPVSEEGREALKRDSYDRLSRVISAMPVVDASVDTVLRIVAEFHPGSVPDEIKEQAIEYESDIVRRCVLATLSCLVDLGLFESNLPVAELIIVNPDEEDPNE